MRRESDASWKKIRSSESPTSKRKPVTPGRLLGELVDVTPLAAGRARRRRGLRHHVAQVRLELLLGRMELGWRRQPQGETQSTLPGRQGVYARPMSFRVGAGLSL
jgi:hypothetical protein